MWSSHEIEPDALRRASVKGTLTVSRLEVLKTIGRNQWGERERGYGPSRLNGLLPAFLTLLHENGEDNDNERKDVVLVV